MQHTIDIGCHDTVLLLKQKIEEKSGITVQNQILMYRSTQLMDQSTVQESGIVQENTMLRLLTI